MLYGMHDSPEDLVDGAPGHGFATRVMKEISEEDGFKGWTKEEKTDDVTLYSGFLDASRYLFDAGICRAEGWKQYDTTQDAWYFGIWVHVGEMVVVSYVEGDVIVKVADSREAFKAELEEMAEFYGEAPPSIYAVSGSGTITAYVDRRPTGDIE